MTGNQILNSVLNFMTTPKLQILIIHTDLMAMIPGALLLFLMKTSQVN
jgi:hypothetical protein